MEIVKARFDAANPNIIIFFDAVGNSEVKQYPPKTAAGQATIKKLGGHAKISKDTFQYNAALNQDILMFERFSSIKEQALESFNISVIVNNKITKTELMKLKMSMFDQESVKKSKNTDLLSKLRKSDDPVDLIMYFGMLRNDFSNGS